MGKKYVEQSLNRNEKIVLNAKRSFLALVMSWVWGILFFWILFIPTWNAIGYTIKFFHIELAVTNKRVIGKAGWLNSASLDLPLNKVQSVNVKQGLVGKIFKYGTVEIKSAADSMAFSLIKRPDEFKRICMAQLEAYEDDRVKQQAAEMAQAMAGVIKS